MYLPITFKKQYIILNVFFRLFNDNDKSKIDDKLNMLFIASLIKINEVFRKRLLNDYKIDFN